MASHSYYLGTEQVQVANGAARAGVLGLTRDHLQRSFLGNKGYIDDETKREPNDPLNIVIQNNEEKKVSQFLK